MESKWVWRKEAWAYQMRVEELVGKLGFMPESMEAHTASFFDFEEKLEALGNRLLWWDRGEGEGEEENGLIACGSGVSPTADGGAGVASASGSEAEQRESEEKERETRWAGVCARVTGFGPINRLIQWSRKIREKEKEVDGWDLKMGKVFSEKPFSKIRKQFKTLVNFKNS